MNPRTAVLIGAVSGLIVGGLAGYFVAKKQLKTEFENLLDEEVKAVKHYYSKMNDVLNSGRLTGKKTEVKVVKSPHEEERETAVKEYEEVLEDFEYTESVVETLDGKTKVVKVRSDVPPLVPEEGRGPIDYESEETKRLMADRDPAVPYLITVDEFMDDNLHFEKQTLTYFEGDDSLCDARDELIPDIDNAVGFNNLNKFGVLSKDKHIVYVRNERIASDFEIAYDERTYVEAIAGFNKRILKDDAIQYGEDI